MVTQVLCVPPVSSRDCIAIHHRAGLQGSVGPLGKREAHLNIPGFVHNGTTRDTAVASPWIGTVCLHPFPHDPLILDPHREAVAAITRWRILDTPKGNIDQKQVEAFGYMGFVFKALASQGQGIERYWFNGKNVRAPCEANPIPPVFCQTETACQYEARVNGGNFE